MVITQINWEPIQQLVVLPQQYNILKAIISGMDSFCLPQALLTTVLLASEHNNSSIFPFNSFNFMNICQ